ncbi:MAG: hypothetical protein GY798_12880 [Hyphomicrobiales bacterium]|nr:hypothetical protein [Hyphomicrobiales bacterium]
MNQLDGIVRIAGEGQGTIGLDDGVVIPVPARARAHVENGQRVVVGIRPDDLAPKGHGLLDGGAMAEFDLEVAIAEPLGTETLLFSTIGGKEVQGKMLKPRVVEADETMRFVLAVDRVHVFDAASGRNVIDTPGSQEGTA